MIKKILDEIFNLRVTKRRENIDDLIEIYNILNCPSKNSKIIHIAGTNGKGSTASYLENILFEANFTVGKFTSPHILTFNERIVVNKNEIENDKIIEYYNKIKKIMTKYNFQLNFFEITTFIALLYFEEKKLDYIILETGLGGRLDATNIVKSNIAVITNISFDHTNILGNTLEKISYEKAGIIKENQLCIFSQNLVELKNEISKKTNNTINLIEKYKDLEITLDKDNFKTLVKIENDIFSLPLFGKFQAYNFLIAYEISKIYKIDNTIIKKGLEKTKWPARFEIFSKNPMIILDAAHNDDSILKLKENLKELYKNNEIIIITSILDTKDIKEIFKHFYEISDKIFITSLKDVPYGLTSLEILEKLKKENISIKNIDFENDIFKAYKTSLNLLKDTKYKAIVVCGSFYEISKFKKIILKS